MFNFSLISSGTECFVTYNKNSQDSIKKQTVTLDNFKQFLDTLKPQYNTELNSQLLEDTGFLPNSLIRRTKYTTNTVFLFYYQTIFTQFKLSIPSHHSTLIENLVADKLSDHLVIKPYNSGEKLLEFKKHLKVHDVYYRANLFANTNFRENVLFGIPNNSTMFKEPISKDSVVSYSFLPNHFDNYICWGRTETDYSLHFKKALEGDLSFLDSHAYLYLNSVFNSDLLQSPRYNPLTENEKSFIIDFYTRTFETDRSVIEELFRYDLPHNSILAQIAIACDVELRKLFSSYFRTTTLDCLSS